MLFCFREDLKSLPDSIRIFSPERRVSRMSLTFSSEGPVNGSKVTLNRLKTNSAYLHDPYPRDRIRRESVDAYVQLKLNFPAKSASDFMAKRVKRGWKGDSVTAVPFSVSHATVLT